VLSYGKLWVNQLLLASGVPEDPYLSNELQRYFPELVRRRFPRAIRAHRLRREIIATATTNSLVNRMGPAFVLRAEEDTGASAERIARAYTSAREIFDMREVWADIEALDNRVAARLQYSMMHETSRLLRHASYWLLRHRRGELAVRKTVAEFRAAARQLAAALGEVLAGVERERFEKARLAYAGDGVPPRLAARVASLPALIATFDIAELARRPRPGSTRGAASLYFELGRRVGLDWLRAQIEALPVEGPWQAVARAGLRTSALRLQRQLTERVLSGTDEGSARQRVAAWEQAAGEELAVWQRTLSDMRAGGSPDFATLTVGLESLHKLAD
jgi:glutamate dehydrogenase